MTALAAARDARHARLAAIRHGRILAHLRTVPRPLSVPEIARVTGVSRSTAYTDCAAMAGAGLLAREDSGGTARYRAA